MIIPIVGSSEIVLTSFPGLSPRLLSLAVCSQAYLDILQAIKAWEISLETRLRLYTLTISYMRATPPACLPPGPALARFAQCFFIIVVLDVSGSLVLNHICPEECVDSTLSSADCLILCHLMRVLSWSL